METFSQEDPHRKASRREVRRALAQLFLQLGIEPGDKLLVRRGEETKEIDLAPLFEAQPK